MYKCLLCGAHTEAVSACKMCGVASDGRKWPHYGALRWCSHCGHVQKETGQAWQEAADAIYKTYTTYAIAGSQDQQLFLGGNSTPVPRFHVLIEKLHSCLGLGSHGALLDYGCGDGNFLQAFSTLSPHWDLYGHEYGPEHRDKVLAVAGVRAFSCGDSTNIHGEFDGISMQHVLEHVLDPRAVLQKLTGHLKKGGWLFTQLPTFWNDPFELMVVDHCSHFTEGTLHNLLVEANLDNFQNTVGWIPKNIGFVSRIRQRVQETVEVKKEVIYQRLLLSLHWLADLPLRILERSRTAPLGILGTSNAATWTASMLPDHVKFFVDEDPGHWGFTHLGLPVISPKQTSAHDCIFVAFAPSLASSIASRLNKTGPGHFFSIS